MTDTSVWATWARELQAMAANGLTYAADGYDRERYHRLHAMAVEMLAELADGAPERIAELYLPDKGYVTPKVDVRAAVLDGSGRLLLVRERSDGLWALPGGWADVGDSPAHAAVRETAEEAGYLVEATGLVGLYDRDAERWHHPPHPYHIYKVVVPAGSSAGRRARVGTGRTARSATSASSPPTTCRRSRPAATRRSWSPASSTASPIPPVRRTWTELSAAPVIVGACSREC